MNYIRSKHKCTSAFVNGSRVRLIVDGGCTYAAPPDLAKARCRYGCQSTTKACRTRSPPSPRSGAIEPLVRLSQAVKRAEFVLPDHALVTVDFMFDPVLSNSAVHRQQPNDSVLTLRFAIDPRAGKEFDMFGAVSVDEHEDIAF